MKVLVTGGAGFIGTNLVKKLLSENHEVYSLDNYICGLRENEISGCTYIDADIENINKLEKDFDVVYHLAALSRIQPSFNNPSETFRVNVFGTQKVCEFVKNVGAKLIYAGSSSRWHNPHISPYACYKYLGEEICKMYKKSFSLNVEIARFYNVYGPYEVIDGDWAAVIGIWRRQVNDNQPITIVGDGEQRRDFTHVEDVVDGLYKLAISNESCDDGWEFGTGINYSINEVYDMFKEKFGIGCIHVQNQKGNYRETIRMSDIAIEKLGWKPEDTLRKYILNL